MNSGASVCPTNMFAAAFIDSARLVPSSHRSEPPMTFTTRCMMPRWKSTATSDAMKMTTGSTWRAKTIPSPPTRSPNRKLIPASEEEMTVPTASAAHPSSRSPGSQYSTSTPRPSWIASAPPTVRSLIARRSVDTATAMPIRTAIPPSPHRMSMALRKLVVGPGGPDVAYGSLSSVTSKEWPSDSPGRSGR